MAPYRANLLLVVHDNYGKFFPVNQQQAMVTENSAEWMEWYKQSRNVCCDGRVDAVSYICGNLHALWELEIRSFTWQ